MEPLSTQKQLTLRKKSEIKDLLNEAIGYHDHCEAARASVLSTQRAALWHAWQAGIRLNMMKALIGRGDWLDWLDLNFCKPLKISVRTAQLYMKIDSDNVDLGEKAKTQRVAPTEADLQLLTQLKFDSIRKYAFTFIPEKEDPYKGKDIRLPRLHSFLKIVNEYNRLKYRHIIGLDPVNFAETRRDTVDLYHFLQWVHGDSPINTWESNAYRHWRTPAAQKGAERIRKKEEQLMEFNAQRFLEICGES